MGEPDIGPRKENTDVPVAVNGWANRDGRRKDNAAIPVAVVGWASQRWT